MINVEAHAALCRMANAKKKKVNGGGDVGGEYLVAFLKEVLSYLQSKAQTTFH